MTNDHNEPMQEVIYKGKTIKFKIKHFPGTPEHLTMIASNYFECKELNNSMI